MKAHTDIMKKLNRDDRQFKGLFSVYNHFINIIQKEDYQVEKLLEQLKEEIATTNCDEIHLTNIDLTFAFMVSSAKAENGNMEITKPYIQLFALMKWFYKNNKPVLENSKLYEKLSKKTSGNTIVIESEVYTHEKIRLILKSIDTEPVLFQTLLDKVKLLPSYRDLITSLYGIHRSVKGDIPRRQLGKLLKSEEMCCVIQTVFDKVCDIDIMSNFEFKYDQDSLIQLMEMVIQGVTDDLSEYCEDIIAEIKPSTDYSLEQLENINRDLRTRYKVLRIAKYNEEKEVNKPEGNAGITLEEELEAVANEKVYNIDFGLSLQQKKDILSTSRFLLLKSDDINIVPVMDNVRMESIYSVTTEILKGDYDAIIVLTKNVAHSDVYRIKSLIGNTPLIYTARTNRKLIIEDVYNQF